MYDVQISSILCQAKKASIVSCWTWCTFASLSIIERSPWRMAYLGDCYFGKLSVDWYSWVTLTTSRSPWSGQRYNSNNIQSNSSNSYLPKKKKITRGFSGVWLIRHGFPLAAIWLVLMESSPHFSFVALLVLVVGTGLKFSPHFR